MDQFCWIYQDSSIQGYCQSINDWKKQAFLLLQLFVVIHKNSKFKFIPHDTPHMYLKTVQEFPEISLRFLTQHNITIQVQHYIKQ